MDDLILLAGLWLALSIGVAIFARNRGRDFWAWFGVAVVFSPLLAFILLLLVGPVRPPTPQPVTLNPWSVCGRCGVTRAGKDRYCSGCGQDYWAVPPV